MLLFVINFYTHSVPVASSNIFPVEIFNEHPLLLIIAFFFLFAIKNLFGFIVAKQQYRFVYHVASRISKENLLQFLHGSYNDYVNIDSSIINRKISQQPIEFAHYVLNGIQQVFSQSALIIISIVAILIFNPVLFPLLIVILAPPVILIGWLMKRRMNTNRLLGKKTSEQTIQHLQEALAGFVESNTYGKHDFFTSRYHRFQSQLNFYLAERHIIQSIPSRLIEVFAVFGLLVLVLLNHFTAHSNTIELVTIGAFMAAAYKIIPGIVKIMNLLGQVKTYAFSAEDLSTHTNPGINANSDTISSISFENVSFDYADKNILNNFSLKVDASDMIGITGLSGKGKTTVANLLLGFLEPVSGNIKINDSITTAANRQAYWNKIAYIKQQTFFIHASIIENITLSEKDHDREKIKKIIALTGIDQFFKSLPAGLETIITENGKNFSGGQRQRIIFARALYKDFDLLILDEPFNELDEASETAMLKQLQMISREGKIILLITHNNEALAYCNKKMMMDAQQ